MSMFTVQGLSAGRAVRRRHAEGPGGAVSSRVRGVRRSAMVMVLAAALGVTALSMSSHTSTAAASSQGCTYTSVPFEYVCFNIKGTGTWVDSFSVTRGKVAPTVPLGSVCNFKARIRVTAPDGTVWQQTTKVREGCVTLRATVNVRPGQGTSGGRAFLSGSRACGSFYENDVLQDTACNMIHR